MTFEQTRPNFWQRRIVRPVVVQLTQGVTPDKIALTFAAGLICGVFPFLGFTTLLCFIAAVVFRLNQPLIHILNQLLWPAQLSLIAVYVKLGARLFGAESHPFDPAEVARVFMASQREFWVRFGVMGIYAFTAWLISAPALGASAYYGSRPFLRKLASAIAART